MKKKITFGMVNKKSPAINLKLSFKNRENHRMKK
jgi:hypothetical protein